MQLSVAVRNARADAIESAIGASPTLKLRSGSAPANCATADSGTVLATMALPSDWMGAASAGAKGLIGTWTDASADNSGTVGHFRIYDSGGTCHWQGTAATTGADATIDNSTTTSGQAITVTSLTLIEGNA
jgi:hypothetical protein